MFDVCVVYEHMESIKGKIPLREQNFSKRGNFKAV